MDGSILKVDDFLQNYNLTISINHYEAKEKDDPVFKVIGNRDELKAKEEAVENGKMVQQSAFLIFLQNVSL